MLTDLQLQEIKNTIPNIEITEFDSDYTSNGYIQEYQNDEFHFIFGNFHIILKLYLSMSYGDVECYNGFLETIFKTRDIDIKIVNIAHLDTEYDFTKQQENEIINSIKEITFKN